MEVSVFMNKNIRKISEGAMFLAIVGAALLINRGLSFILDQYVSIISSLVLIVYIKRFSFKDGLMMAFGIFFLSFMFGGTYVLLYAPLSILAGLVYGYGIERGFDSKRILFTLVILYTIGEFALTFIFLPMFGFGDLNEMTAVISEMLGYYNISLSGETLLKFTKISYAIATFLLAIIEAILLHLCTIIIFKKFKLGEIKMRPLSEIRIRAEYAYASIASIILMVLSFNYTENEIIIYSLLALSMIGAALLIAQGYIFCLVYGIIVFRRNISITLVLMILVSLPYSLIIMIVLGFLYSTGPLYKYIVKKRGY